MSNQELIVVANDRETGGGLRGIEDQTQKVVEKTLAVTQLQESYHTFVENLRAIFSNPANAQVGDFMLEEINFNVEISAKGEFKLVGTGIGAEAGAGISFKLTRQLPDD